jgi:uncharacterized radical SAM superfamily Fe-S cluster-containing enzyme
MAMIEVTNRCNMACPVCFTDANHPPEDVPFPKIRQYMEGLLDVTGSPIPVQISGGEPTLRKDLPEIVSMARTLGFRHIELITNGIKISQQPELLQELRLKGLKAVYLQFDGLKKEIYLNIRGQDMTEVRHKAIEAARQAGLCCTLAVTVARGINDSEISEVVRFGISNIDTVRAIDFHSATRFSGRFNLGKEKRSYGLPALIRLIESQTGIPAGSFRSEHLGHPLCNAMSPVFVVNGRLEPLFNYISRKDMMDFLGVCRREKVLDLFNGKREFFFRHLSSPGAWKFIAKAQRIFGSNPLNVVRTEHILLFAKGFMERDELSRERVRRCCYGIATEKGVFSFCAFNNLYRFSGQRWLQRKSTIERS